LVTHQLSGESRGGDDDTFANAMMIGWVGGSCPALAVLLNKDFTLINSLHVYGLTARSDCQTQQDSDNDDKPRKLKGNCPQTGSTDNKLLANFN